MDELKTALRKGLIASYKDAYLESTDTWKNLETKAQATIAIAGVLVAAVVAFIEKLTLVFVTLQGVLLAVAVAFLLYSIYYAIMVLKIQHTDAPPYGDFLNETIQRLLTMSDENELKERAEILDAEVIAAWGQVTAKTRTIVKQKAKALWDSQICLIAAIVTGGIVAIIQVLSRALAASGVGQ